MIVSLHGTLLEKNPARAVVECGGVGYETFIPLSTYERLPACGAEVRLVIAHVVREDAELLFGFATEDERLAFTLVTAVSGVGPKTALGILSGLSRSEFKAAIVTGDVKRLASVKGVGKKTAERLVVELKDKIDPLEAVADMPETGDATRAAALRDATLALTALGFTEDAARERVRKILTEEPALDNSEIIVRRALGSH